MRKFVIAAALAASALTVASPAAAQYYPQPQGNAYGYNNYGHVRSLQVRIDQIQRQISRLDNRNILSEREAARLRHESRQIEQRLRYAARNGLHPQESYGIQRQIQRLEVRLQRDARDGNRYAYGGRGYSDRDRDGLNDRLERDRGTNYDEDRDYD